MRGENRKLLQIIPAGGWLVVYKDEDKKQFRIPLACWALCVSEDDGEKVYSVEGMQGFDYVDFCVEDDNFVGYRHGSEPMLEKLKPLCDIGRFLRRSKNDAD